MARHTIGPEIDRLIQLLARLPGLGPRSARRAALHLIKRRDQLMEPLGQALAEAQAAMRVCSSCGNIDTLDPCHICQDPNRDSRTLVVVETVDDLWALERAGAVSGRYHVLGGTLSPLDGVGPDDLNVGTLASRLSDEVSEVVIALNATVEGQTTAHYLSDLLSPHGAKVSRLAYGVPVGGELDYLDEGTLAAALRARTPF